MKSRWFGISSGAAGLLLALLLPGSAEALVKYDEGSITVNDVVLLQDADDPNAYYYLPPYPRVASKADGAPDFVCIKYVGAEGQAGGGLLHFLVAYDLPFDEVEQLQTELRKKRPAAKILGAVRMFEKRKTKADEEVEPAFKVVSAVLNDGEGMTRTLISSGHAPLIPGSKTPVAAMLSQEGATLLWETLDGPTSDISISIHAYYEAKVEGFRGTIQAEVSTVYTHFSNVLNRQRGYKKRELRDIVDTLVRDNQIRIEVFDRAEGLQVDTGVMRKIVDLCTDKLVDLIFDHETGLAKLPEREIAVERGQIRRRQERGGFVKFFAGAGNPKYITDDQYVMKSREDIKRSVFSINLSATTTIRVPFDTSGNIGGFYRAHKNDERLFRTVHLADPTFQTRQVHFTVDREFLASFQDTINSVAVSFRKRYRGNPDVVHEIQLTHEDVAGGEFRRIVSYPRLGLDDDEFLSYDYRLSWSVFGRKPLRVPEDATAWLSSTDPVVVLAPPFDKSVVELELDRTEFENRHLQSVVVEVRYRLFEQQRQERRAVLRSSDVDAVNRFTVFHDRESTPEVRITWFGKSGHGKRAEAWQPLESDYLLLVPPDLAAAATAGGPR